MAARELDDNVPEVISLFSPEENFVRLRQWLILHPDCVACVLLFHSNVSMSSRFQEMH